MAAGPDLADLLLPPTPIVTLAAHVARGGGDALHRAHHIGPDAVIAEIEQSGLRGRGGGGFPTGRKWRALRDAAGGGYCTVVANGAEGEPGTFKDRPLLRANPFAVIEGLLIAASTLGASACFIGVKASFTREIATLDAAIVEVTAAGWLDDIGTRLLIVEGPDAYLFGEETALLEVIEGEDPLPRQLQPYLYGLFSTEPNLGWSAPPDTGRSIGSNPTLVNNVETFANIAPILRHGAAWFRSFGTVESPGVVITTVSGDTVRAGYGPVELGTPIRAVVDQLGGGVAPGRQLQAVLSGVANPVLTGDALDAPLSYEGLAAAGSGLGAAGLIVFDDTADMVAVAYGVSRFLAIESCGQCSACKLGTVDITGHLDALLSGAATPYELDLIIARLRSVTDGNRCYLPVQEQRVIASLLTAFPEAFNRLVTEGAPPVAPRLIAPLLNIDDCAAIVDERHWRKRPDWTYAEQPVLLRRTR